MPSTTLNPQHYQTKIKVGNANIRLTNQSDNDRASVSINNGVAIIIRPFPNNRVIHQAVANATYTITYNTMLGNPDVLVEW